MIKLHELRVKLFGRSRKELLRDMHFLCLETSDILEDMLDGLDGIQESHNEYMRIMLRVQEQCDEIIKIYENMQKRDADRIINGEADVEVNRIYQRAQAKYKAMQDTRTFDEIVESIQNKISNMSINGEADGE